MKNTNLPPLREGETLSSFALEAIQLNVERRENQREFIVCGLRAREEARAANSYVAADEMLSRLDEVLAQLNDKAESR